MRIMKKEPSQPRKRNNRSNRTRSRSQNNYRPRHSSCYTPHVLEKIMFWSLVPATVILPAWLVAGRALMGGPRGWGSLFLICTWGPITFLYHLVFLAIHVYKNYRHQRYRQLTTLQKSNNADAKKGDHHCSIKEFYIGEQSAVVLLLYYATSASVQFFMMDGNQDGSVGSLASSLLGIDNNTSSQIGWVVFMAGIALALELLFLAFVEDPMPVGKLWKTRTMKTTRQRTASPSSSNEDDHLPIQQPSSSPILWPQCQKLFSLRFE